MTQSLKFFLSVSTLSAVTLFSAVLNSCCSPKETKNELVPTSMVALRDSFWNVRIDLCFPDRDTAKTTFLTSGMVYADFVQQHPQVKEQMFAVYGDTSVAKQYLPGVINSGSSVPVSQWVKAGDSLFKIASLGTPLSKYSPYYLTKTQLNWIKQHPCQLEQKLGLPLSSVAAEYVVYCITPKKDSNQYFTSSIAPTRQFARATPDLEYTTVAGATQSLILNVSNSDYWEKNGVPIDTISPSCLPK